MAREATVGLWVKIEALPGKEEEVAAFLKQGAELAQQEAETVRWFGVRIGPTTFGVFDAFPDDSGRKAHLNGEIAKALLGSVGTLVEEPAIHEFDVLAEKDPA